MQKLLPIIGLMCLLVGIWLFVHAKGDTTVEPSTPVPIPVKTIEVKPQPRVPHIFKPKPKPDPSTPPAPPIPQSDEPLCKTAKQYTQIPDGWEPVNLPPACPCEKPEAKVVESKTEPSVNADQNQTTTTKYVRRKIFRR
jgi:hypothetical protein